MSRFNTRSTRPQVQSVIRTETVSSGPTHQGGPGFSRSNAKSELFLLGVSEFAGESTFYESASERETRLRGLVSAVAVEDIEWITEFLHWLRTEGNLRTVSISAAVFAVKARLDAGLQGGNRQLIDAVIQRADEPGEILAAWTSRYGRAIPKPVKRGVEDAVRRLYSERSLLKYDSDSSGFRFGDVIDLVHPSPAADKTWQSDLFKHAIDRRHGREEEIPESLTLLRKRAELMALPQENRRDAVTLYGGAGLLAQAGMTWEALAGWLQGPMDAAAWEAVIPSMGYMALLRNLRNFDQAGVSGAVTEQVARKLSDPAEVASSRQLPMRFLSAYKAAGGSLRWVWALEQALNHSLANVPTLKGRTLILVDRSGSMFGGISEKSGLNRADSAAIFGSALARRAEAADLVEFGTGSQPVSFSGTDSVLKMVERFTSMGGTNTHGAVRQHFSGHDRIVIVTDEQSGYGGYYGYTGDVFEPVPAPVRKYTWNLAGYERGHAPSGSDNQHTFGGLSDQSFKIIPLLEANRDGRWPWEA